MQSRNFVSSYLQVLQVSMVRMWNCANEKPAEVGSMNDCNSVVAMEVIFMFANCKVNAVNLRFPVQRATRRTVL